MNGKVLVGIVILVKKYDIFVIVIVGSVLVNFLIIYEIGIDYVFDIINELMEFFYVME